MLLNSLGLTVAALTGGTGAFLIPPEISQVDIDIVNALPLEASVIPDTQRLQLPCPGCPYQVDGQSGFTTEVETHLELDFHIAHGADHDRLYVNKALLFPLAEASDTLLHAPLLPNDPASLFSDAATPYTPLLGYGIRSRSAARDAESGLSVTEVDLQIIQVGNTFLDGVPDVHLKMVADASGRMTIADLGVVESLSTPQPSPAQDKCGAFCGWIAAVKSLARKKFGRPCRGKMGHRIGASDSHGHPHRKHHHHHGKPRSWRRLLDNIVGHIFLPIAFGIVAGVGVSFIGMIVGTFIVSVWRTFFRRSQPEYLCEKAASAEQFVAEEKSGLLDNQGPPPAYEDEVVKEEEV